MDIDRLALPRPPKGVVVGRELGEVRIAVARFSAWRWPLGAVARGAIRSAGIAVLALFFGGWAAVAAVWGPGDVLYYLVAVVALLAALLAAFRLWMACDLSLRGPTIFTLTAEGVRQTFGSGRLKGVSAWSPWDAAGPSPLASGETGEISPAENVVPVSFGDLGGGQARWMDRVLRRATHPLRKSARREIVARRGEAGPVVFEKRASWLARLGIGLALAASAVGVPLFGYAVATGQEDGGSAVQAATMAALGMAFALLIAVGFIRRLWRHAWRERLVITGAAVGVERRWMFRGRRRRRAVLEDVRLVAVVNREVQLGVVGGTVRAAKPLTFRVPRGTRPARLADEVRQLVGLAREDRGFPVVVPTPAESGAAADCEPLVRSYQGKR